MLGGQVITGGALIVKFVFEISKKMFPTASTLMRPKVVDAFGTVIASDPSLGVLGAMTIGKVFPPSVESVIFTFAQLTGAADVPAMLHVTVCDEFVVHTRFVFGCVTANGPLPEITLTCIVAEFTAPPPERLSRAVT
jgi:hypothetical protein